MLHPLVVNRQPTVALRKESVDRNMESISFLKAMSASLSARRAWIEIRHVVKVLVPERVALRKESVDRNDIELSEYLGVYRRSPQGERG